ncbi:hypothetical protein [Fodinicola feengrottensis]|uniref:hypothetical protein n=1 Tax=Fodinicola feengrottensis TaxID=435914 RepID=UPI0024432E9B|nr:hypothetical protein [Fodinicola feengrottensis]
MRLRETPQGASLVLEFAGDLYDDATAERMLDHLLVLLRHVVGDAGTRLGALPLAGETERARASPRGNRPPPPPTPTAACTN